MLSVLLPACAHSSGSENGSIPWVSSTHMKNLGGFLGSWVEPGPALAVVAIWGVESADERFFSFTLSNK